MLGEKDRLKATHSENYQRAKHHLRKSGTFIPSQESLALQLFLHSYGVSLKKEILLFPLFIVQEFSDVVNRRIIKLMIKNIASIYKDY